MTSRRMVGFKFRDPEHLPNAKAAPSTDAALACCAYRGQSIRRLYRPVTGSRISPKLERRDWTRFHAVPGRGAAGSASAPSTRSSSASCVLRVQRPEHQTPLSPAHRLQHFAEARETGLDEVSCGSWARRSGLSLRAFNKILERVEVLVTQRFAQAATHPLAGRLPPLERLLNGRLLDAR
jgi:hypothetical protein